MNTEIKPAWIVGAVLVGILAVALLLRTSEELLPELLAAHVAIRVDGSRLARVAPDERPAGTSFTLHAVVEATDWRGRTIYYTDAPALEIGGVAVDPGSIRAWDRSERLRILWFTVVAVPPYTEITTLDEVKSSRYREVFQADWPQAWTVPGRMDPAVENFLPDDDARQVTDRFGTQRFHVRVEVFGVDSDLLPSQRLRSPGAVQLEAGGEFPSTFTAVLDPPLESLSRFFGLPQVEPIGDVTPEVSAEIARQTAGRLLFSRTTLLRTWLDSITLRWEDLSWQTVELTGEAVWPVGGLVRAGSKVAILFQDRGVPGRLDDQDLCLDFGRGATVRTLGEVFIGEGLVDMATVEEAPGPAG